MFLLNLSSFILIRLVSLGIGWQLMQKQHIKVQRVHVNGTSRSPLPQDEESSQKMCQVFVRASGWEGPEEVKQYTLEMTGPLH